MKAQIEKRLQLLKYCIDLKNKEKNKEVVDKYTTICTIIEKQITILSEK